jgi:AraC family transcriptional regulator
MSPLGKALWFIESHFGSEITLDDIAEVAGVSSYYLTRALGDATGHSVMRYVRGRRLTEAARSLADGAQDILSVALDAGYGSHEAFTRAFRDQFAITPEALREEGHVRNIKLLEPIKMEESVRAVASPVRFEHAPVLLIAGMCQRYSCETSAGIPAQWQRFQPHIGTIPGQIGKVAYGVRCNIDEDGDFDYVCGVAVSGFSKLTSEWSRVRIPAQKYAVFSHAEHVSTIRSTWTTIWNKWLPASGHELVDAPDFERYGEEFDSRTGCGGLEIWIPMKA